MQRRCNKSPFTGVLPTNTVVLLGYGLFNACYMGGLAKVEFSATAVILKTAKTTILGYNFTLKLKSFIE